MRIDEILGAHGRPVFSFEFFPPKTDEGEQNLFRALAELADRPDYVSVTYGAGGTTREKTIDIVSRIKTEYGMEAMPHFTCVNATTDELRATLEPMRSRGVRNVLALRGDPPAGARDWTMTEGGLEYSAQLVALIKDEFPEFAIGGACFPETHIHASSPEADVRFLKDKVDAGAQFLITQLFLDNRVYFDFVDRARDLGIGVPIIPGILPITNVGQLERMSQLTASAIPPNLMAELDLRREDPEAVAEFGVAYATLQCAELLAGGAPGIHFYTLNRSPATRAILSALRLMKPWVPGRSGLGELTPAL